MPRALSYAEDKAAHWGLPVPPHIRHGSGRAAGIYGCNCSTCLPSGKRKWKNTESQTGPVSRAERFRRLRARKKGTPVPPSVKHGGYAYKTYGCRCRPCVEANYRGSNKSAWRNRARGLYAEGLDEAGKPTTIRCWPPKDAVPGWTCPECGNTKREMT